MYVTDAQVEQVYNFIWDYLTEREELPTVRQIAAALHTRKKMYTAAFGTCAPRSAFPRRH